MAQVLDHSSHVVEFVVEDMLVVEVLDALCRLQHVHNDFGWKPELLTITRMLAHENGEVRLLVAELLGNTMRKCDKVCRDLMLVPLLRVVSGAQADLRMFPKGIYVLIYIYTCAYSLYVYI